MNTIIRDCKTFLDHLQSYLDSELDAPHREAMDQHARSCPDCAEELDRMTHLLTMCAELDEGLVVPKAAQTAWRQAVREAAEARGRPLMGRFAKVASVMAAALVVLAVGTQSLRQQGLLTPEAEQSALMGAGAPAQTMRDAGYGGADQLYHDMESELSPYASPMGIAIENDSSAIGATTAIPEGGGSDTFVPVVIKSATRTIESTDYERDFKIIREDIMVEYDAYFEMQSMSGPPITQGAAGGRAAELVIRVPSEKLTPFLSALDAVGQTVLSTELAEDISSNYRDTQARLTAMRTQLTRLNEMARTSTSVEDSILIEEKLSETLLEIERLEGRTKNWDSHAALSRVTIALIEVTEETQTQKPALPLGERISGAFKDAVAWLKDFSEDALVTLVIAAPKIIIGIPALALLIIVVRVMARKARKNR